MTDMALQLAATIWMTTMPLSHTFYLVLYVLPKTKGCAVMSGMSLVQNHVMRASFTLTSSGLCIVLNT